MKKILKKFSKVSAVLLLLSTLTYSTIKVPQWHKQWLLESVGENVVYIESYDGGGGTGFVVDIGNNKKVVATNHHVCTIENAYIRTELLEIYPVHILKEDPVNDLCLLSYNGKVAGLSVSPSDLNKGRPVYVVGHPALLDLTLSYGSIISKQIVPIMVGRVESAEQCGNGEKAINLLFYFVCIKEVDAVMTSAQIQPGSSGSPVVNDIGQVIGVIFAGDRYGWGLFIDAKKLDLLIKTL